MALPTRLHAALAAGFGSTLAIVGEISWIVAGAAAAMAVLAAAPSGFDRLFAIIGEVAGIAGASAPSRGLCRRVTIPGMAGRRLLILDSSVALGSLIHLILPPVVRNRANAMPDTGLNPWRNLAFRHPTHVS
jgi:hypothetical protein